MKKITTTIEFEITSCVGDGHALPVMGLVGNAAYRELTHYLGVGLREGYGVTISRVHSEVDVELLPDDGQRDELDDIFRPEERQGVAYRLRSASLSRFQVRKNEEDDSGVWNLVGLSSPPMTVLGLSSAMCLVSNEKGEHGEARYLNTGSWVFADGTAYPYHVTIWSTKPGIDYSEPQDRYDAVAEENKKKGGGGVPGVQY